MGGACSAYEGKERRMQVSVGKPEGKSRLARSGRRCEDNIKMDLREVGYGGVDYIEMAQVRARWRTLVNAVMNVYVP